MPLTTTEAEIKHLTSPVWTAVYSTDKLEPDYPQGCYHLEFGHPEGPPIDFKTALRLAKGLLPKMQRKHKMQRLHCIFNSNYENRFDPHTYWYKPQRYE